MISKSNQNDVAASTTSRDEIVRQHMGLVQQAAERLGGSIAHSNGSFDDLVSAGMIGLLGAFDGFDETRGAAFSTFAYPRVRGAILDELRRLDHAPRSLRRKSKAISKARATVEARSGGRCTEKAVADEMGVDLPTFWRMSIDGECGTAESLDSSIALDVARSNDSPFASSELSRADAILENEEQVESVRNALSRLPEQERLVLILSFYEDLKLRQIGEILGVSESRISQIRSRALVRLRSELAAAA